jgi:hypothetical protein
VRTAAAEPQALALGRVLVADGVAATGARVLLPPPLAQERAAAGIPEQRRPRSPAGPARPLLALVRRSGGQSKE